MLNTRDMCPDDKIRARGQVMQVQAQEMITSVGELKARGGGDSEYQVSG